MIKSHLVGYCSIYCGVCYSYSGEITGLSRYFSEVLQEKRFDEVAKTVPLKEFKHYKKFHLLLKAMANFCCPKGCRGSGKSPFFKICKIRECCQTKGYQGCWECDQTEVCRKFNYLHPLYKDAHIKNLKKIRKAGFEKMYRILPQLGKLIRTIRKSKGLTLEKLAEKADLHSTYIGAIERGDRNPSILSLIKIAKALNTNIFDFIPDIAKVEELVEKDYMQKDLNRKLRLLDKRALEFISKVLDYYFEFFSNKSR